MKLSKLVLTFLTLAFSTSMIGCGPYYPYYYEEEWIVEEPVVVQPHGYYTQHQLTFKISWDTTYGGTDLDVSVVTPSYHFIEAGGFPYDGCLFTTMGTDNSGMRYNIIECDDPDFGTYDIQIENMGVFDQEAIVEVIEETRGYDGVDQLRSHQHRMIESGDTVLVSYSY